MEAPFQTSIQLRKLRHHSTEAYQELTALLRHIPMENAQIYSIDSLTITESVDFVVFHFPAKDNGAKLQYSAADQCRNKTTNAERILALVRERDAEDLRIRLNRPYRPLIKICQSTCHDSGTRRILNDANVIDCLRWIRANFSTVLIQESLTAQQAEEVENMLCNVTSKEYEANIETRTCAERHLKLLMENLSRIFTGITETITFINF